MVGRASQVSLQVARLRHYFSVGIWRVRIRELPFAKRFVVRWLRILVIILRSFKGGRIPLRASSLTFYSLLSIVPVFAMLFGIAKGFGLEKALETQLLARIEGQEEALRKIIEFANTLLQSTRGGLLAGVGVVVLLWSMIKVLGNIETAFNEIWEVKRGRSIWRKITDYLSLSFLCPLLLVMSSTATVIIVSRVRTVVQKTSLLEAVGPVISLGLRFLPYGVLWILFTFIYIFMPNTKVRLSSALTAGIVAGSLYEIFQKLHIHFQIGVAKYNAIYGSFAALPLFLIWLQISWLIVLVGAELSYAHQSIDDFEMAADYSQLSRAVVRLIGLRIVQLLTTHFDSEAGPLSERDIADQVGMSRRLTRRILNELVVAGLVSKVLVPGGREDTWGYQPAKVPRVLTVHHVMAALDQVGINELPLVPTAEVAKLMKILDRFDVLLASSPANIPLDQL